MVIIETDPDQAGDTPSSSPPPGPQWTEFSFDGTTVQSDGTVDRKVYVSNTAVGRVSSGAWDATHGSIGNPYDTIAYALTQIRTGHADWLLLRCDDTFTNETFGECGGRSGRSLAQRMLISSYNTGARPIIKTAAAVSGVKLSNGAGASNYIAFVGLHFVPNSYSPSPSAPNGIDWLGSSTGLLIEDCLIEKYTINLRVSAETGLLHTNTKVRYNIVLDSNAGVTLGVANPSDGGYFSRCDDLVLIGNVWDSNGWADGSQVGSPSSQNLVIHSSCTQVLTTFETVINCDGIQQRCGGYMQDCLFLHNVTAIEFCGSDNDPIDINGHTGRCSYNVILDGNNRGAADLGGTALKMSNCVGAEVESNTIVGNTSGTSPRAISLGFGQYHGIKKTAFRDNIIYGWRGPIAFTSSATSLNGTVDTYQSVRFKNNVVQDLHASTSGLVWQFDSGRLPSGTPNTMSVPASFTNDSFFADNLSEYMNCMVDSQGPMAFPTWLANQPQSSTAARFEEVSFIDNTRSIATYMASIGGTASLAGYRTAVRLQSKQNWNDALTPPIINGYIRDGYTVTDVAPAPHEIEWTAYPTLHADDRAVYVSSSGGSDSYTGLEITGPFTGITGMAWTYAGFKLTKVAAFAAYSFTAGDRITITSGSNAVPGTYTVASKTSDDEIVLTSSCSSAAANGTNFESLSGPKLTIAAGFALIRNAHGDRLLLKRDSTFTNQRIGQFNLSGVSASRPIIFGAYDTGARPIIDTQASGFITNAFGGPTYYSISDVWFDSLDIRSSTYDGGGAGYPSGLACFRLFTGATAGCRRILIQNVRSENYSHHYIFEIGRDTSNVVYLTRHSDITIRGCSMTKAFDDYPTTHVFGASGMLLYGIDNVLVEFVTADQCGVKNVGVAADFNIYKHVYYVHNDTTGLIFRNNTDLRSGDTQLRSGGIAQNNMRSRSVWGYEIGGGTEPQMSSPIHGEFTRNCILETGNAALAPQAGPTYWNPHTIRTGTAESFAYKGNISAGGVITQMYGWLFEAAFTNGVSLGLRNCIFEDNIQYNVGGFGVVMQHQNNLAVDWIGNSFRRNHIQNPGNATGTNCIYFLAGVNSGHFSCSNNVLNAFGSDSNGNGGSPQLLFSNGSSYRVGGSSPNWESVMGDATTTAHPVIYANSSQATLGGYYRTLFATTGTEDGDHDAMVALMVANETVGWEKLYTAPYVNAFIRACFAPL